MLVVEVVAALLLLKQVAKAALVAPEKSPEISNLGQRSEMIKRIPAGGGYDDTVTLSRNLHQLLVANRNITFFYSFVLNLLL